jgi:hypothetical protein
LTVDGDGLASDKAPLPDGGTLQLQMNLTAHEVVMSTSSGDRHTFSMEDGQSGTAFADMLIAQASEYGLEGAYHREIFESDDAREYDRTAAEAFLTILVDVNSVFRKHICGLDGGVSPVQVWPHGFDLAVDWFGTRMESHEENGEVVQLPSRLNLGFYPGGRPYFYSNPWPFEEAVLLSQPLPHGAEWHTEGWQGSILYYDQLAGDPDAEKKLREHAAAVSDIAAPTLTS